MAITQTPQTKKRFSFKTDMPLWVLAVLAMLAMPRAVIHDLKAMPFDSFGYIFLAVAPLAIYLAIAIFRNNKRPMYDFVVMGVFFSIFLTLIHQILWNHVWGDNPPALGDQLEGKFSPDTEMVLFRIAAIFSGLHVGIGIGAVFGTIALIARRVRARRA